jgi:hypothetical protein
MNELKRHHIKLKAGEYPAKLLGQLNCKEGKRYTFIVWIPDTEIFLKLATNTIYPLNHSAKLDFSYFLVLVGENPANKNLNTILKVIKKLKGVSLPESVRRKMEQTRDSLYKWHPSKQSQLREQVRQIHRTWFHTNKNFRAYLYSKLAPEFHHIPYGLEGLNLDHVIALASFDLEDPEQFKLALKWENVRLMPAELNAEKLDKR